MLDGEGRQIDMTRRNALCLGCVPARASGVARGTSVQSRALPSVSISDHSSFARRCNSPRLSTRHHVRQAQGIQPRLCNTEEVQVEGRCRWQLLYRCRCHEGGQGSTQGEALWWSQSRCVVLPISAAQISVQSACMLRFSGAAQASATHASVPSPPGAPWPRLRRYGHVACACAASMPLTPPSFAPSHDTGAHHCQQRQHGGGPPQHRDPPR